MRARPVAAIAALLVLAAEVIPAGPARAQAPATVAAAIDAERLMDAVRTLSSEPYEGRGAGTAGGAKARAWVTARFTAIGLSAFDGGFERPFTFTPDGRGRGDAPVNGANVVGRCAGADPALPFIVLSAHYDHMGVRNTRIYPGADDNASGVAALVEIAAACVAEPFRHGLIVAAFDAEEMGLRGARAFLESPPVPRDRLALNVNLDMVARGDSGELHVSGLHHTPRLRPVLEPVAARAPIAVRFGHDTPGSGRDDWTMQSDHGVFHQAGIPFVYFGVEDHADYHQPTDTADKIDPVFFARAAGVVLDALRALDRGLR